jgi:hypothetical protein
MADVEDFQTLADAKKHAEDTVDATWKERK